MRTLCVSLRKRDIYDFPINVFTGATPPSQLWDSCVSTYAMAALCVY